MCKEKKEHAKSIRMTSRVLSYVEAQEGNGFNEKFEKMVLYAMENESRLRDRARALEKEIARLDDRRKKLEVLVDGVERMKWNLDAVMKSAEALAARCDSSGASGPGSLGKR